MIDISTPLSQDEARAVADSVARRVVGLGLALPAILFLEMHRPLGRLAGQAVVVATPVLAPVFGLGGMQGLSRLLYHPGGIDLMIESIEDLRERDRGVPT